jgi:CPA2 family monovalent cation:H+ antiporter-2
MAMTESVLRDLGATPDQIDRERERLHADLFGAGPVAKASPAPVPNESTDGQAPRSAD